MAKKKKDDGSSVKSMTRTGANDFVVEHHNGQAFECKIDDSRKFNAFKGLKNNRTNPNEPKYCAGVGDKKELHCDICKERVYKATYKDGKYHCPRCL